MEPTPNSFKKNNIHHNQLLCIGLIAGLWTIVVILVEHASLLQAIGCWAFRYLTPG